MALYALGDLHLEFSDRQIHGCIWKCLEDTMSERLRNT